VKNSIVLYWSLAILGIVFLTLVLASGYLDSINALNILASFSPTQLGLCFVVGGIVFFTVGIVRQYFKNHRKLVTALAILLIPPLTFITVAVAYSLIIINAPMFPMRSEITQVTVVDTIPLVLSLGVKAITSSDTRIDGAIILNSNNTLVAETSLSDREWIEYKDFKGLALAVLPAGSEITLTLNFNTTLPSGNYLVRLTCWSDNHGSSFFTAP
jgi:hypothetical protein